MAKLKSFINILRRKIFFYIVWPLAFRLFSFKPIDEKLILFAFSKNYTSMPDNLTGLYEYLKDKGYNCKIMQAPQNAVKRILFDITFQKYYARCKCVFITDNFDPLYAHKPNKGTKVIQLWHACGAFKKWGYSTLDLAWGGSREDMLRFPMHNTYTDVFVSAESVIPCYAEAFGCNEKIIKALGTPRTDVYFDKEFVKSRREELLKAFPAIGNRKIILYAPTFRGNSPEESYNDQPLDYAFLKETLGKDYALVLKLHPFTAKKYKLTEEQEKQFGDFVFDASNSLSVETALCAADYLVADYSSLVFEYALLDKPMIFFAYDLEKYKRDRSFYFEYESFVPGRIVMTNEEIAASILSDSCQQEKIADFRKKYMSACDGKCIERIAEYAVR
ncbi:MAG: CDP-glycerol glycerophosphotransferase family protein [Clostridia bacterium]|nr:CDP-glycerol glycerophosphotransferase family protein [Clostridia bacterium]